MRVAYYIIPWEKELVRVLMVENGVWMMSDNLFYQFEDAISTAIKFESWSKIKQLDGGWRIEADWFCWTGEKAEAISRAIIAHDIDVSLGGTPGTEVV
jgi:hypothetical protein